MTLALSAMLAGCAALPGGGPAPLDTYELSAPETKARTARSRLQILVTEPTALKALDSENVVIKTSQSSIEYLKGAQWADRLPRILQTRLAETLQRSGGFGAVGKPGEGLAIDYQLITEIRAFEIRVDGTPRAEVELFVRVLNDRNGVVRAQRSFSASKATGGAGNASYIAAIDAAFGEVASDIVRWADRTL